MSAASTPGNPIRLVGALLAGGALWLAPGCGPSRAASGPQRPASGDELVCIQDPQTGSHIVETRCFKRADLDERRAADRAILDRAQMNSNRPVKTRGDQ